MKKILLSLALILPAWTVFAQEECGPFEFPSYNVEDTAAANAWGTDIFELSQSYPAEVPEEKYPWDGVDFRRKPEQFMSKVLDYCWEGMNDANFVAQSNAVRIWYHAPWLDYGFTGREYLRGLRMDRTSAPDDLSPSQNTDIRNYSISYYNGAAAYTLGQVWCDPKNPEAAKANFPLGSVIFKMIFTLADTGDVAWLDGALEWDAYAQEATSVPLDEKEIRKVRLIEVDYMVKSDASDAVNGWIFGSHVYDGRADGGTVKDKLVPVGLQWGNDPGITPAEVRDGEQALEQTWLNTKAWVQDDLANSAVQKTGYGYRLQGVVGNHSTSLMAEAATASWPPMPPFPPSGITGDSIMHWHRNLPSGTPFDTTRTSLDYSLELRDGLRNWTIATKNDSIMKADYRQELGELLAFQPPVKVDIGDDDEEEVIEYDEGLKGRNLFVFIGGILLVVVMLVLLVMNFLKKDD
ncbi:MAG: hypothetical protein AAGN35_27925 [Bacteroidota bacterium]